MNPVAERHYRVNELVALWMVSRRTIIRLFKDEPGVLKLGTGKQTILSIPESVAARVHQTLSGARPEVETGRALKDLRFR